MTTVGRMLGLWGDQTLFILPERLPALPANVLDLPDIERVALASEAFIAQAAGAVAVVEVPDPANLQLRRRHYPRNSMGDDEH